MNKRFYFVPLFVLALILVCVSSALADTMYVSTMDGDPLNVRNKPEISVDTLIGCIPNHSALDVISIGSDGWAKIYFKTDTGRVIIAYVSCRYLSYDMEGYYRSKEAAVPLPTPVPKETDAEDNSMEEMNNELKKAKTVEEPFSVLVRPSRSSGRVNLRWAPSNKARAILSYPANKKLDVLIETPNWYQVRDPEQGYTGFIAKKYVTVVPTGLLE